LGDDHVDRAVAATTDFDRDFQQFITRTAWGQVWDRPGLDLRTRSMITIAILAALGRLEELELHLGVTPRLGVSPSEVSEVLLHVAVYAGIPAANRAFGVAKRVLDQGGGA
jgi:4-carboxymuconolactone decarboxylase